jgi:HPt (histidine-containing phosphotransfer) domain-containing protein
MAAHCLAAAKAEPVDATALALLGVLTKVREGDVIVLAHRPHPALSVLDPEIIGRLRRLGEGLNEDLLAQLTVLFLTDADVHVHELRKAIARADAVAIVGSAHALRGASANLGATGLVELCSSLEADTAADDLSSAVRLVDALVVELARVRSALGSQIDAA